MNGWDWFIIAVLALGAVFAVATVDEPRKPISAEMALAIVLFHALLIIAVVLS